MRLEPEPEQPPAVTGLLYLSSPGGWAEVRLGERKLGTTPGRFELPEGTHLLSLLPFGEGPEIKQEVEVSSLEPGRLAVALP